MDQNDKSTFHVERAQSVLMKDIVETMNQATDYCSYLCNKLKGVDNTSEGAKKIEKLTKPELLNLRKSFNLDVATERAKGKLDYEGPDKVVVNGRSMNIQTGITVYGNEGHTNLPATSRAARFFGYVFNEVTLTPNCNVADSPCRSYDLGDVLHGLKGSGKIVALSFKKNKKGLAYPASRLCKCAGPIRFAFIRIVSKQGRAKKYSIEKVKLS